MSEKNTLEIFKETEVLEILKKYLKEEGWNVNEEIRINGGRIDICAKKDGERLLIEAKGEEKGGYGSVEIVFLHGLGQLMSRMRYQDTKYCLAFPLTKDFTKVLHKYRGSFAFERLGIYLITIERNGKCRMISPPKIAEFLNFLNDEKLRDNIRVGLDTPSSEKVGKIAEAEKDNIDEKIEIELCKSCVEQSAIDVPKNYRELFPGYKVPFILETNVGEIETYIVGGPSGTKEGDPNAGYYFSKGLSGWFKQNNLKIGGKVVIEIIETKKRYKLYKKEE